MAGLTARELFIAGSWLLCSCGLVACGLWDLSSLTRDRTHVPCVERQILSHWTTREISEKSFIKGTPGPPLKLREEGPLAVCGL